MRSQANGSACLPVTLQNQLGIAPLGSVQTRRRRSHTHTHARTHTLTHTNTHKHANPGNDHHSAELRSTEGPIATGHTPWDTHAHTQHERKCLLSPSQQNTWVSRTTLMPRATASPIFTSHPSSSPVHTETQMPLCTPCARLLLPLTHEGGESSRRPERFQVHVRTGGHPYTHAPPDRFSGGAGVAQPVPVTCQAGSQLWRVRFYAMRRRSRASRDDGGQGST